MESLLYGLIGAISGLNSSCWGSYKDSLYEKFYIKKFLRSIFIGFILGIFLFFFLKINNVTEINLGVFFLFTITFERLFTESFKAFIREEEQDKYKIPSKLHIFGKIIKNKFVRLIIGVIFISLAFLFYFLPSILNVEFNFNLLNGLFWGIIAGLVGSAVGGAWKDAPIEGFKHIKFLRSIFVSGVWGIILSFFTNNYSFLLFACIGGERMTIEFYKTFIIKHTPGKFKATKSVYPRLEEKRKKIIIPYILTWFIFLFLLVL